MGPFSFLLLLNWYQFKCYLEKINDKTKHYKSFQINQPIGLFIKKCKTNNLYHYDKAIAMIKRNGINRPFDFIRRDKP